MAELLFNFANSTRLLRLPGKSRILDVACGGGWLTNLLVRMNYDAYGFAVNEDFVDIARRRLGTDPLMLTLTGTLEERLFVHDIEADPLPAALCGALDVAILESCAHHFYDPVGAFTHIADGLTDDGVVVVRGRGDVRYR